MEGEILCGDCKQPVSEFAGRARQIGRGKVLRNPGLECLHRPGCGSFFHLSCTGLTKADYEAKRKKGELGAWTCPHCIAGEAAEEAGEAGPVLEEDEEAGDADAADEELDVVNLPPAAQPNTGILPLNAAPKGWEGTWVVQKACTASLGSSGQL